MKYEIYFLVLMIIFMIILITMQYILNKIYIQLIKIEELIKLIKNKHD